ncbi:hypothetical protein [Psychrobacter fjordensis]|uniref:hypothetical protein n=1 Tax=Psychrobacter fjordensis TaxID=664424 RepID=UPI0019185265|nr:hypothetical protein [Psychrobacter fjordensis]
MKTLARKLVEAHSYIDKSSNITDIVNEMSSEDKILIEHIIEKIDEKILEDSNKQTVLIELDLGIKIRLLATIYNKASDIILYPKEMREEYIQIWSDNLGLENSVMRKCLVMGADKIDNIISMYNV